MIFLVEKIDFFHKKSETNGLSIMSFSQILLVLCPVSV